ncbi:amino acid adenylation domain-containing protein [Amycolatopsis sacchari]|uniref:amino acid adenylation domain-containing protein n=1 Tax=Amycolatopsis sacchari TaxID=115433 RepID=UPI003D76580A
MAIAQAVHERAQRTPSAIAVVDGDRELDYQALDNAAASVANGLLRAGVRPGQAVAVALPRSWQLICTMLGILRLGGRVVPLDVDSPPDRRRHILADSGSVVLVSDTGPALSTDELLASPPVMEPPAPPAAVSFLFYTSGTTGQPKGVEVREAGILRLARPGYIQIEEGARYACLANPAFDALSFEVWVPLLTGGTCVVLDAATVRDPEAFAAALVRQRVDALFVTTALFNAVTAVVPGCFATTRQVLVGGEQLSARMIQRWYRHNATSTTRLYNGYGPTETTTFAVCHAIPRDFTGEVVPIGHPLPGTEAVLVAPGEDRLAEPGETAELYLAGDGLAAGYRNLPDETAAKFVRLPWRGDDRLYRTGDLVRAERDGTIVYIGRTDRQVKVRGFRVEPGEIEHRLLAHPAIRQAHVVAHRAAEDGPLELLAYLVLGEALSFEAFEEHLSATLPGYLRPHHVYVVGTFPRTRNGKIDEAALLRHDGEPWRPAAGGQEATDWQREVLDLAEEVLGVPPRLADRWVAAGGDSLKALALRFAIQRRWGCDVPLSTVLDQDFAGLAVAIAAARSREPEHPAMPAPSAALSAPATSEQQRLWLLQQRGSRAYDVAFTFRLDGEVDVPALRQAVRTLVGRHVALRTGFAAKPEGLRQVVGEPYDPWEESASSEHFFAKPFDLAEPRMFAACFLPDENGGFLLLRLHHIAVDGWSVNVLLRELSAAYAGETLPDPPHTPLDFAPWQQQWFATSGYRRQRDELRAFHGGAKREPVPPSRTFPPARLLHRALPRGRVDELCAELGLTRFQLLLAVFAWSLYAVTGRTDPGVGAPVTNRPVREFGDSVGMFANTVLLPLSVDPEQDLRTQLEQLAAVSRTVLDRQDVALADVLDVAAPPEFLFVLENTDFDALTLPGCDVSPVWTVPAEAKYPVTMSVVDRGDGFECLWEYADDRFGEAQIAAMADLFPRALDALAGTATPRQLAAPYRQDVRGPEMPLAYTTIAEGFARQVAATPDAPAVYDGEPISYARLDAYASALAAELAALPRGDHAHVALFCTPSVEHVVALLALAKLNLTAVPLDPAYPPALLREVLDQVGPLCVLLRDEDEAAFDALDPGVRRHRITLSTAGTPKLLPHEGHRPLYTLFTSGSTGVPKGVRVWDRTLANLLQWQATEGGLGTPAVTQQFSMLSFDVSFQEIFGTLCGGGCLHLVRPGWRQDLPALLAQLESAGVERLFLPSVALQLLAEHGVRLGRYPSRLREVITAGEQLVCTDALRRWFAGLPGARLFNHYGPTETHVVSALCLDGDPSRWPDRPAIGRPIANTVFRVVDADGENLPPGQVGELLIGGPFVRRCYLGDDALNERRFTADSYYRSGDLAHLDEDGLFHFAGRADDQLKISGYRVEPGQLETALLRHPGVVNAVVARDGDQLVACLQVRDEAPSVDELRAHLAPLLPAHLRVDRFRVLPELPRTPSGKVDRAAAPHAPGQDLRRAAPATARSPLEARLATVFEEVTGSAAEPDETFFAAGASSLALMRFQLRCTAELGLDFTVADLFEHVTIRALARFLEGAAPQAARAQRAPRDEPIAVIGMAVRLPGAPDLAAFWDLVRTGGSGIEHFDAPDGLVGARSRLADPLGFDPAYFGISPRDAALMDPQQRQLLLTCVQALAHAGIADPSAARVGLVAGCGENTYFQTMLREADPGQLPDPFQLALHHDKDFLATKAAYHLGLTGPAFTAQSACSSSLVAVHLAAGLLRQDDADVVLAGGVLVDPTLWEGYRYRPQHIFSEDGYCRSFGDDATGTVGASGAGIVVLKPLSRAREDGDTVYSVLTGSAINNDGAAKLGYGAPSVAGQREVIRTALRRSGRSGGEVAYVEAHGTGTRLGDPVEVSALRQALGETEPGRTALSTVKSQLGHLGAAAGVVGLVRATLAVHHGVLPPTPGFRAPNPRFGADFEPFFVPAEARPWPADRERVAAVSSFGIGGTNAHVVLEAGPATEDPRSAPGCLVLSASSETALRTDAARIADHLDAHPDSYPQVLRHVQAGRAVHRWRLASAGPDAATAAAWLRSAEPVFVTPRDTIAAADHSPSELADAWLAGHTITWPEGPAPAPWNFPPPAFDLADYHFRPTEGPLRRPESDWLHQPTWARLRRASTPPRSTRTAVLMTANPSPDAFDQHFSRVVRVTPSSGFAQRGPDAFEVDPADPVSLGHLLDALDDAEGLDWLHALPLDGDARWACLDTSAALLRAAAGKPVAGRLRTWWLSWGALPADGEVRNPWPGLLAGIAAVGPQETRIPGHWLDLPDRELGRWAPAIAGLVTGTPPPERAALRQGYWWTETTTQLSTSDTMPVSLDPAAVHLVLGGTGGIGSAIASWLLTHTPGRVLLLARHPRLPTELERWADRIDLLTADLATGPDLATLIGPRLDTVVHAAGTAAGSLLSHRDPATAQQGTAAKLQGVLVVEELIERYRPAFAVYCSSMAARFGGLGQLDYAAANSVLDSFAQHRPEEPTERLSIAWDVWRETGMAVDALAGDPRHQAHLAVGLTVEEGQRMFARALSARVPHVLVSTVDLDAARAFYSPATDAPAVEPAEATGDVLARELRSALGVDELDPEVPLTDLGADSLTMLDLVETVKRHFGVDLELSWLGPEVTLTGLLARISEAAAGAAGTEDVRVEVWQHGTGRDVLCLVHPVGGDIQAYRPLVAALDPRLTVCLIADPALRAPVPPEWPLAERARRYHAALQSRFPDDEWRWQLGGWSFGSWVALGMAAEAEAAGRPVAALHLFDPPAPDAGHALGQYDETELARVFALELGSAEAPAQAYAERLARCCRANLASMATHRLPRLAATPSRLWFATRPTDGLPAVLQRPEPWQDLLTGGCEWHHLDTTHYELLEPPHVRTLAATLGEP